MGLRGERSRNGAHSRRADSRDQLSSDTLGFVSTRQNLVDVVDVGQYEGAALEALSERVLNPVEPTPDLGVEDWVAQLRQRYDPAEMQLMTAATFVSRGGNELVHQLQSRGFSFHEDNLRFVREHDGIYDVVEPNLVSDGVHLVMHVFAWVSEIKDEQMNEGEPLPSLLVDMTGAYLGSEGLDCGTQCWVVARESSLRRSTPEIVAQMETVAEPWFKQIRTKKDFLGALTPTYQRMLSIQGSMVDRLRERIESEDSWSAPRIRLVSLNSHKPVTHPVA